MKCYEVKGCSEKARENCFVYQNFRNNIAEMENLSCWILKKGSGTANSEDQKCPSCPYYQKINQNSINVNIGEYETVVIECCGTLNAIRCAALSKVAERLSKVKRGRVVLDLSNVNNIYSCALGLIVRFYKQCSDLGGRLVIVGATGYVKIALASSKLDRFILQVETIKEAYCAMSKFASKEEDLEDETSVTDVEALKEEISQLEESDSHEHETKIISTS